MKPGAARGYGAPQADAGGLGRSPMSKTGPLSGHRPDAVAVLRVALAVDSVARVAGAGDVVHGSGDGRRIDRGRRQGHVEHVQGGHGLPVHPDGVGEPEGFQLGPGGGQHLPRERQRRLGLGVRPRSDGLLDTLDGRADRLHRLVELFGPDHLLREREGARAGDQRHHPPCHTLRHPRSPGIGPARAASYLAATSPRRRSWMVPGMPRLVSAPSSASRAATAGHSW